MIKFYTVTVISKASFKRYPNYNFSNLYFCFKNLRWLVYDTLKVYVFTCDVLIYTCMSMNCNTRTNTCVYNKK